MSDQSELERVVKGYAKAVEVQKEAVKKAAENIETVRQVQTESPNR